MEESTIALFCCLHDFARMFSDWEHHKLIPSDRQRRRAGILSLAEMLLIMVLFHTSPYKKDVQGLLVRWAAAQVPPLLQRAAQLRTLCGLDAAATLAFLPAGALV